MRGSGRRCRDEVWKGRRCMGGGGGSGRRCLRGDQGGGVGEEVHEAGSGRCGEGGGVGEEVHEAGSGRCGEGGGA